MSVIFRDYAPKIASKIAENACLWMILFKVGQKTQAKLLLALIYGYLPPNMTFKIYDELCQVPVGKTQRQSAHHIQDEVLHSKTDFLL